MSSVLHPVGPEPRERYWVRRLAVLVAAVVAIVVVIALVGNAMSAGSAVQAEPAPPSVAAPTLPPATTSASPSPEGSASPAPDGSPTAGAATPSASTSASPTAGSTVTPDPGQTPKAERSTPPTSTEKKKAEQRAAEKKAAAKKAAAAKKKAAPVLASCPADDVRSTLTGPRKVKAKKSATFELSLINGSGKACYVKVTSGNFRLTIVSGSDRVWSSADCPKAVPATSRKLTAEKSVEWTMRWDGTRSGPGCKTRPEAPKAGYYWAIANFDDAREVRWRVILT